MKILNNIACNLNWIELNSDSTKFKSTTGLRLDWIQFKFNWKEMRILVEKVLIGA
jgi:hypothetical protein